MPTTTLPCSIIDNDASDNTVIIIGLVISGVVLLTFLFLMCKTWFINFKEKNHHEPTLGNFCKYSIFRKNYNRVTPEDTPSFKQFKHDLDLKFERFYTEQISLCDKGITELETDLNDLNCSICLDKLSGVVCRTKCNHMFHKSCLIEWLKDETNSCPTCRATIIL
jgi:hypothetical protein